MKLFTALFRHVYPMTTWGEVLGYESYPENVKSELYYGPDAGKPTDKMHLRVFAAKSVAEVAFLCEADAISGYGTQVLCIWEGDVTQVLRYTTEHVLTLPRADAEQRTRCA